MVCGSREGPGHDQVWHLQQVESLSAMALLRALAGPLEQAVRRHGVAAHRSRLHRGHHEGARRAHGQGREGPRGQAGGEAGGAGRRRGGQGRGRRRGSLVVVGGGCGCREDAAAREERGGAAGTCRHAGVGGQAALREVRGRVRRRGADPGDRQGQAQRGREDRAGDARGEGTEGEGAPATPAAARREARGSQNQRGGGDLGKGGAREAKVDRPQNDHHHHRLRASRRGYRGRGEEE
mmetsp:Transcript_145/g.303  ORF Transcript_145/g.303 Transcript_145/m.303 type:complete len:237 (+) Transcript_145:1081-1791(+)